MANENGIPWQDLSPEERMALARDIEFTEAKNPGCGVVIDVQKGTDGVRARVSHIVPQWDASWFVD